MKLLSFIRALMSRPFLSDKDENQEINDLISANQSRDPRFASELRALLAHHNRVKVSSKLAA